MNKKELVKKIAEETKLSQKVVHAVVNAATSTIASVLESGQPLMLVGFGTFGVAKRSARTIVHPATGKKMRIPSKHVPVFRPGSELKKKVRRSKRPRGRPRKARKKR